MTGKFEQQGPIEMLPPRPSQFGQQGAGFERARGAAVQPPNSRKHNNRSRLQTVARWAVLLLLGAIVGINAYSCNSNFATNESLPMPFGYGVVVAQKQAMEPAVHDYDLVIVASLENQAAIPKANAEDAEGVTSAAALAVGEIVAYDNGANLVLRRVVSITGTKVVARADASDAANDVIALSEIKGRMITRVPVVGLPVKVLSNPIVATLVLLCAIVVIEVSARNAQLRYEREMAETRFEIAALKEIRDAQAAKKPAKPKDSKNLKN